MKAIGIIPARYASSRFPGKPLADIAGKTMIQRVYEQAKKSKALSQVIVATDDDRIYQHVRSFGGEVMMTATHHKNGTERCAEVVEQLNTEVAIVVNIQGDEPLAAPEQIDLLVDLLKKEHVNIGTLVKNEVDKEVLESPNTAKVAVNQEHRALYFSRLPIPHQAGLQRQKPHYRHIGMYAYKASLLPMLANLDPTPLEQAESLEQLRWLEHGYSIYVAESKWENHAVDIPSDVDKIINIIKG